MKDNEFMQMLGKGKPNFVTLPENQIKPRLTSNGRRSLVGKTEDGKNVFKFVSEDLFNKYAKGKKVSKMSKSKKSVKKLMKLLRA